MNETMSHTFSGDGGWLEDVTSGSWVSLSGSTEGADLNALLAGYRI